MTHTLITGGAGFIGYHVAVALAGRGDQITIVDDFNNRYDPRLKEARAAELALLPSPPHLVRGDIRDQAFIDGLFRDAKFDKVLHLAAWASVQPSIDNPYIYTAVNVDGTVNLLEAARKHDVDNFVFASSSSVYGGRTDIPFRETDNVSRPWSPYAATKAAGEILCATWHNLYGLPISCLRFFTVYGPWGRPEMAIFKFSEAILTGQAIQMRGRTTQRDFTYIDDIVAGVVAALEAAHPFEIFNLGESDAVQLPRLIAALEAALGKKAEVVEVPLPAGDIPATLADITKAQSMLNYHPTTSIEEGTKKFAAWYQRWYLPHFGQA